jgi:hypothetical protein
MSIFPVKDIAKAGVITDVDPYNLPIGAWSWGQNVRFRNNSITRAPVCRSVFTGFANVSPRYLSANFPSTGFDQAIVGFLNGRVTQVVSGSETDLSITGYTNADAESSFTSCHLGDVFYVNRSDRVPWSLKTTDTIFQTLDNWDTTWRANILRSSNSALCAFGITKGATSFPTMVKTSEFAIVDTVPSTWDDTLGTNNATENVLGEMEGPITDAQALGEIMIVYGLKETWTMQLDGSQNIWGYHRLFSDAGAISADCSVEVDKKHYVFGLNDIWMHDGNSKQSISDERVREFVFAALNVSLANRCRVVYNNNLKEIYFQFVSGDAFTSFPALDGCNRQAVYHVPTGTWSFDDLPYTFGAVMASVDVVQEWATVPGTWDTTGGTWFDQQDSAKKVLLMVGDSNTGLSLTESLYAFDLQGPASAVSFPVDTNATKGWRLIRDGLDLDQVGVDLPGYKLISSIYPQARLEAGALPITFSFGSADFFNDNVVMSSPQTYDGSTLYKLDYNAAGRYLSLDISHADYHYVRLTQFDVDLDVTGER